MCSNDNDKVSGMRLKRRRGLLVGIANNRSIATGCARAFASEGARLAVTHQDDRALPQARPVAEALGAEMPLPLVVTRADIVQKALDRVRALGVDRPRATSLSAVETATDRLPSTLLAAAGCKMHDRGPICGGLVHGPRTCDNAIPAAAAQAKGICSPVAGQADIPVAPNLESGNMIARQLIHPGGAEAAGVAALKRRRQPHQS